MPRTLSADRTNLSAITAQAQPGDTVVLKAYPNGAANPYTLVPKAGVAFLAEDWVENRVLRGSTGYKGRDLGVHVTNALYVTARDVSLMGVYHNTERANVINALLTTATNFKAFDCAFNHRRLDGGRQIGITVQGNSVGFGLYRCRGVAAGQPGTRFDHALYVKDTFGWVVDDTIWQEGGYFPLHLYPNARGGVVRRPLVYGGVRCATFSGANDPSTGLVGYNYSKGNVVERGIFHSTSGSIAETWNIQADAGNLLSGVYVPAGVSSNLTSKPGLDVSLSPWGALGAKFTDPANGDFSYDGPWVGYGPQALAKGVPVPPPPPPDPDPTPDDTVEQLLERLNRREAQLAEVRANLSLGEVSAGEARDRALAIADQIAGLRSLMRASITTIDS